jgi:hypothetical protein
MTGLMDPFNRRPFAVADESITDFYRQLGALRRGIDALRTGWSCFQSTNGNIFAIMRYVLEEKDAFGNKAEDAVIITIANPSETMHRIVLDMSVEKSCIPRTHTDLFRTLRWEYAQILLDSSGAEETVETRTPIKDGLLDISVPPMCAQMYRLQWS